MECNVCAHGEARYRCPRCNARYCSSACYISHGGGSCSEFFFKENVVSEIALQNVEEQGGCRVVQISEIEQIARRQVIAAFERSQDVVDGFQERRSADLEELESRIKQVSGLPEVAEVNDEVIEKRTVEELESVMPEGLREKFEQVLKVGGTSIVRMYKPWWEIPLGEYRLMRRKRSRKPLVEEIDGSFDDVEIKIPHVWFSDDLTQKNRETTLKELRAATLESIGAPAEVSPSFKFHVSSVCLAYVHALRKFNGALDEPEEAIAEMLQRSGVLRGELSFLPTTLEEVLLDFSKPANVEEFRVKSEVTTQKRKTLREMLMTVKRDGDDEVSPPLFREYEQQIIDMQSLWKYQDPLMVDVVLDVRHLLLKANKKTFKKVCLKLWMMAVWLHNTKDDFRDKSFLFL